MMKVNKQIKRFLWLLSLLLIIAMPMQSCKKYPEGPFFSLQTPGHRILGDYHINKCTIDGKDFTSDLDDVYFEFSHIKSTKTFRITSDDSYIYATYAFPGNKDYVELLDPYAGIDDIIIFPLEPFLQSNKITVIIKLLTQKKFYCEIEYLGKTYRYELEED